MYVDVECVDVVDVDVDVVDVDVDVVDVDE